MCVTWPGMIYAYVRILPVWYVTQDPCCEGVTFDVTSEHRSEVTMSQHVTLSHICTWQSIQHLFCLLLSHHHLRRRHISKLWLTFVWWYQVFLLLRETSYYWGKPHLNLFILSSSLDFNLYSSLLHIPSSSNSSSLSLLSPHSLFVLF